MRALKPLLEGLQSSNHACNQPQLLSAWLQHLLSRSSRSMHSSSTLMQRQQLHRQQQQQQGEQQAGSQQFPHRSGEQPGSSAAGVEQDGPVHFSIRPSALSPLHPYHREILDEQRRLDLLKTTLIAQVKLAQEISPQELEAHADSPDSVAAALAARRAALQAVYDAYSSSLRQGGYLRVSRANMHGYYALMESSLKVKDRDLKKYQEVVEGKEDVWKYWFEHFTAPYAGLPGLGPLEGIYKQQDEDVARQKLVQLQASSSEQRAPRAPQVDHLGRAAATGGRKTSVAQVFLWKGQGRILVNRKPVDAYFRDLLMRSHVLKPLMTTSLVDQLDVLVQVQGGGVSGQAQAAAHGIAKALVKLDPGLRRVLKSARLLQRDPRAVERKKFGRAKARKAFAWVKR